ncbi:MAG: hypothetical protein WC464_02365 [Bdellovibrionales bacterium]
MTLVCGLSTEEDVACQLADLALQLHKRGWVGPYKHVVKARDVLLLALDGGKANDAKQRKTMKSEDNQVYVAA